MASLRHINYVTHTTNKQMQIKQKIQLKFTEELLFLYRVRRPLKINTFFDGPTQLQVALHIAMDSNTCRATIAVHNVLHIHITSGAQTKATKHLRTHPCPWTCCHSFSTYVKIQQQTLFYGH